MHLAARIHQSDDERLLDRGRVGAEVVAHSDPWTHAHLVDQRPEPETQRLYPHEIDFFLE